MLWYRYNVLFIILDDRGGFNISRGAIFFLILKNSIFR
jgi:hypothetical protein